VGGDLPADRYEAILALSEVGSRRSQNPNVLERTTMIRIATQQDLPAITAIYNQVIAERNATADLEPKRVEEQLAWFMGHVPTAYPLYVYEWQGDVCGWCSISPYRKGREALQEVGEISYYVEASQRGQGIGSRLVEHALGDCQRIGKRVLLAMVIEGNAGSLALLMKYGFTQWGYLPNVVNLNGVFKGHIYMGKEVRPPGVSHPLRESIAL
jgi:phosphinothricin acetyltransferase